MPEPGEEATKALARLASVERCATTVERLTPRATARGNSDSEGERPVPIRLEILDRITCARRRGSGPLPLSRHPSTSAANRAAPIVSNGTPR